MRKGENTNKFIPYYYKGESVRLCDYLILDIEDTQHNSYDIYNIDAIKVLKKMKYVDYEKRVWNKIDVEKEYSCFPKLVNSKDKIIYLYTEVYSLYRTKVLLLVSCNKRAKIWVNGKCVSIHYSSMTKQNEVAVWLQKGKNTIVVEKLEPKEKEKFFVQILDYTVESCMSEESLSQCGKEVHFDSVSCIRDDGCLRSKDSYRFMYLANDEDFINTSYRIEIKDSEKGLIKEIYGRLGEVIQITTSEFKEIIAHDLRHEEIKCIFNTLDNKEIIHRQNIYVCDFLQEVSKITKELQIYAEHVDKHAKAWIVWCINMMNSTKDLSIIYEFAVQGEEICRLLKEGRNIFDLLKRKGVHRFAIHSDLDDRPVQIIISTPENYDSKRRYPLIATLSTIYLNNMSEIIEKQNVNEDFFHVDISGRGVTGGSYVGEASIFEILNWMLGEFSIDTNRIYLKGYSNGAYAVWAIGEAHPDLWAGLFPIAGIADIDLLCNLNNTMVCTYVSNGDYLYQQVDKIREKLNHYNQYYQINVVNKMHFQMHVFENASLMLNRLLKYNKKKTPRTILFKTCRARHLKSFWIELQGISKGEKEVGVRADIVDEQLIKVVCNNTDGIVIEIPPCINRNYFIVNINSQSVEFRGNYEKYIYLQRKEKKWEVKARRILVDLRKGMGILDVYLGNLRIIVPKYASDNIVNVANNFSRPCTNGFDEQIDVNYPIINTDEFIDAMSKNNLIIIGNDKLPHYISEVLDNIPVKTEKDGCLYNGKILKATAYCVMQVLPNKTNNAKSVLLIQVNDERVLSEIYWLRKIIIPFYCSGQHPYWNNEILIYADKQYYAAYEVGDKLVEIK